MTNRIGERVEVPLWVKRLHELVLHGTPDPDVRETTLTVWDSHAEEAFNDPSSSRFSSGVEIALSALTHSLWRLVRGPATTVSTGYLVGLVGIASAAFLVSDMGSLAASKNGLTFLGLVLFGYVLARYPSNPPTKPTVLAFALLIPSALWTIWEYLTEPEIPAERIGALGAALCIWGALEFAGSSLQRNRRKRAKAWRLFALGMGAFALANLVGATQYESADLRTTAAIASWIEALLAASLWRNARSESDKLGSDEADTDRPVASDLPTLSAGANQS